MKILRLLLLILMIHFRFEKQILDPTHLWNTMTYGRGISLEESLNQMKSTYVEMSIPTKIVTDLERYVL